jgi:hypothetical protein
MALEAVLTTSTFHAHDLSPYTIRLQPGMQSELAPYNDPMTIVPTRTIDQELARLGSMCAAVGQYMAAAAEYDRKLKQGIDDINASVSRIRRLQTTSWAHLLPDQQRLPS